MPSWNEQVKLVATSINNVALGVVAAGILKPLADTGTVSVKGLIGYSYAALVMHMFALYILERMR